jgi:hypothetical protein
MANDNKTRIILNRQSDLILTNAVITSPSGLTQADIANLVADLAAINSVDVSLELRLSTEEVVASSKDASIEGRFSTAISSEIVRAESAEGSLTSSLSAETSSPAVSYAFEFSIC